MTVGSWIAAAGGWMALVALSTPGAVGQADRPVEPVRRALLVGVDQYLSAEVESLSGCGNDVEMMRSVLVTRFGFAPENVEVLRNEAATREAIITAIRSHLGQSEEGDVALLHYSGRGSRMPDVSGDEADSWDETIVPYDSRQGGVWDISDDEINGLLEGISEKAEQVVVILDTSHSAPVEAGSVARQVSPDPRTPPEPEPWALGSPGREEGKSDFRLADAGYLLISAGRVDELAHEALFDGVRQGALTHALGRALRSTSGRPTYHEVMAQVRADVGTSFGRQRPQLEGAGGDARLFAIVQGLPQPSVLVEPTRFGPTVGAGEVLGLERGDELEVYEPGTRDFETSQPTARVRVTSTDAFRSNADLLEGEIVPHSRSPLRKLRPPSRRTRLFVGGLEEGSPLYARLSEELGTDPSIEIVSLASDAELRVGVTGEGEARRFQLRGSDQRTLFESDPAVGEDTAIARLAEEVRIWAHWLGVLAIHNSLTTLPIEMRLERVDQAPGESVVDAVPPDTVVKVSVGNLSEQPLFLTVLDLTSRGSVEVLHPAAEPEAIQPGATWMRSFRAGIPDGGSTEVDFIKTIVTTEPIPASAFEQRAVPRPGAAPLESFFRRWLAGRRVLEAVESSAWATQLRVLRVESHPAEPEGGTPGNSEGS